MSMQRLMKCAAFGCAAALALGLGACIEKIDPTSPKTKEMPDGRPCPAATAMISDSESMNKTTFVEGRGGYWYTFLDIKNNGGSEIWPTAGELGGTFEMSDGGANGTAHCARMKGTVGGADIVYAGMGLNFVDPKGWYDASKYGGIGFWAKKNDPSSNGHIRLKIPDDQTEPDGKLCHQCFNDHGIDMDLTTEWVYYTVPWRAMKQEDWGPKDNGINPKKIYGIQFQCKEKGAKFDVSVDEIAFVGCK
jgi:endoglucanase